MTSKSPQELFDEAVEEATSSIAADFFLAKPGRKTFDPSLLEPFINALTSDKRFWLQIAEEHKAEIISEWFKEGTSYFCLTCGSGLFPEGNQCEECGAPDSEIRVTKHYTLKQDTELVNPQHDRSED